MPQQIDRYPLMRAEPREGHDRAGLHAELKRALRDAKDDRPEGRLHARGTCAGRAGLCGDCRDADTTALLDALDAWPEPIPPKREGESLGTYARALGLPLVDVWPQIARHAARQARA